MDLTEEQLEWLAKLSGLEYVTGLNDNEPLIIDNPHGSMDVWEPHEITSAQWQINILLKTIKKKNLGELPTAKSGWASKRGH